MTFRLKAASVFATILVTASAWSADRPASGPTVYEQYFVALVNRARANPAAEAKRLGIDLNEGLRPTAIKPTPKPPLAIDARLMAAALKHSQWMIANNEVSHEEGAVGVEQRIRSAGFTLKPTYSTGENLGFSGQTEEAKDPTETMDELHAGLFVDRDIPGRGHRVNLLSTDFRQTGVGVAEGEFRQNGTVFQSYLLTQDFALTSSSGVFLTGIVYADTVKRDAFYTPGEGRGNVTISAKRSTDGKTFTTTTWPSGGYSLELPPGQYEVTASGGGLAASANAKVTIGKENILLDFKSGE